VFGEPGQTGTQDKRDAKLFAESVELFAAGHRPDRCQTKRGVRTNDEPNLTGNQDKRVRPVVELYQTGSQDKREPTAA
jgi:hypothetical protein